VKVLIDTNLLVSAVYAPGSTPHLAFKKAVTPPCQGLICEQSLVELRRVFNRKFPAKVQAFERFIETALAVVEIVPIPINIHPSEAKVRDVDDRPIPRAAIEAAVDILLTGDKDFIESSVTRPKIMTAAQFVRLLLND
jgi:putative PIN family toxin of toxin-antitoxin system